MALTQEQIQAIRQEAGVSQTPPSLNTSSVSLTQRLGIQEQEPQNEVIGKAKAVLGGIGAGVGGVALTGIDYLGRKAVEKFGTEQMKQNIANAPTLQEQFKTEMGGDQFPGYYGAGQLGGEITSLAAPVGAIGKVAKTGAEALGAGQKTAKLTQAATEGLAFTAGQGLMEGEKQSLEDYAINAGLNIAFPGVGMVAKSVGENMPARIINSLIKPVQKDFAYGKNPGRAVAELVPPSNSMEELVKNIDVTLNDVGSRIGQVVSQSPNLKGIDLSYTLKPIDEALKNANKTPRTNQTLISRLESVKEDLVDNIQNGIDPQSYKKLIGELTKWTGNATDDAVINKSLKQVYGSTRDKMDVVFSKELTPEQFAQYKKDSEAYGDLLSAKNAAEHRDKLLERQDLISFGAKNAGFLAALSTAIATGGAGIPAILAGLAGAGVDKAMATPAFKTRLARLLSKLAPKDVETFFDKVPTAKSLFDEQQLNEFIGSFEGVKLNRGSIDFDEIGKTFNRDNIGRFSPENAITRVKDIVTKSLPEEEADTVRYLSDTLTNSRVKGVNREITRENAANFLKEKGLFEYEGALTEKDDKIISNILKELEKVSDDLEVSAKQAELETPGVKMMEERTKKKVVSSLEQDAKKYKNAEELRSFKGAQDFNFKDDFGGVVNARIDGDMADISGAYAKEKGHGLYENAIKNLADKGVKQLQVVLQSVDSTKALNRLVEKGILKNPRNISPVGGYPRIFDISTDLKPEKKVVNSLEQEAKKYKSAEEFVKAKSGNQGIYDKTYDEMIQKNRSGAKPFNYELMELLDAVPETKDGKVKIYRATTNGEILPGDNVSIYDMKQYVDPNNKGLNITAAKMGVTKLSGNKDIKFVEKWIPKEDLYQTDAGTQLYAPNGIKSLTDIWNKANKK